LILARLDGVLAVGTDHETRIRTLERRPELNGLGGRVAELESRQGEKEKEQDEVMKEMSRQLQRHDRLLVIWFTAAVAARGLGMILTDIGIPLVRAGLDIVEVSGWEARGHGALKAVDTIVCHHTAGPSTGDHPSLGVVTSGRPDLAGPLCNLFLARSGTWYLVAAGLAWHAGAVLTPTYGNGYSIGIEAEATGVSTWPAAQLESYERGCAALAEWYGVPTARVLGHKEVCDPPGRKVDPNLDMSAFRSAVANYRRVGVMTISHTDGDVVWSDKYGSLNEAPITLLSFARTYAQRSAEAVSGVASVVADQENQLAGLADQLIAQAITLKTVLVLLGQLQAKVDGLATGGGTVDVAALAEAVGNVLHDRLAD